MFLYFDSNLIILLFLMYNVYVFCAKLLQNIRFFPSTHSTPFSANIQFVYNLIYSAMLRI